MHFVQNEMCEFRQLVRVMREHCLQITGSNVHEDRLFPVGPLASHSVPNGRVVALAVKFALHMFTQGDSRHPAGLGTQDLQCA